MKVVELLTRAASGAVYVALVVGSLLWCPQAFAVVMAFAMVVSMHEFYSISRSLNVKPQYALGMVMAVLLFVAGYTSAFEVCGAAHSGLLYYAVVPFATLVFFVELFRKSVAPFTNIGYTLLGVLYVALPFSLMNHVYAVGGAHLMLSFFILLWANDTFAYIFGITLGRHKLFPIISPKKSWEGYIGGILSVVVFSYLLHRAFGDVALVHMISVGVIISVTGVLGDLVESMLKRSAGVKDSGKIMPGHGGLLDRFDAALLSIPLVFAYVMVFM